MVSAYPVSTYLALDSPTLQRRITNLRDLLTTYQHQADLINKILDHIDAGTIDEYCTEWSARIRDCMAEIEKIETVKSIVELQKGLG